VEEHCGGVSGSKYSLRGWGSSQGRYQRPILQWSNEVCQHPEEKRRIVTDGAVRAIGNIGIAWVSIRRIITGDRVRRQVGVAQRETIQVRRWTGETAWRVRLGVRAKKDGEANKRDDAEGAHGRWVGWGEFNSTTKEGLYTFVLDVQNLQIAPSTPSFLMSG
jgi:hypothetical protein